MSQPQQQPSQPQQQQPWQLYGAYRQLVNNSNNDAPAIVPPPPPQQPQNDLRFDSNGQPWRLPAELEPLLKSLPLPPPPPTTVAKPKPNQQQEEQSPKRPIKRSERPHAHLPPELAYFHTDFIQSIALACRCFAVVEVEEDLQDDEEEALEHVANQTAAPAGSAVEAGDSGQPTTGTPAGSPEPPPSSQQEEEEDAASKLYQELVLHPQHHGEASIVVTTMIESPEVLVPPPLSPPPPPPPNDLLAPPANNTRRRRRKVAKVAGILCHHRSIESSGHITNSADATIVPLASLTLDQLRKIGNVFHIVKRVRKDDLIAQIHSIVLQAYKNDGTTSYLQNQPQQYDVDTNPIRNNNNNNSNNDDDIAFQSLLFWNIKKKHKKSLYRSIAWRTLVAVRWIGVMFSPKYRDYILTLQDITTNSSSTEEEEHDETPSPSTKPKAKTSSHHQQQFFDRMTRIIYNDAAVEHKSLLPCLNVQYQSQYIKYLASKATLRNSNPTTPIADELICHNEYYTGGMIDEEDTTSATWTFVVRPILQNVIRAYYTMMDLMAAESAAMDCAGGGNCMDKYNNDINNNNDDTDHDDDDVEGDGDSTAATPTTIDPFPFAKAAIKQCDLIKDVMPFTVYYFYIQSLTYPTVTTAFLSVFQETSSVPVESSSALPRLTTATTNVDVSPVQHPNHNIDVAASLLAINHGDINTTTTLSSPSTTKKRPPSKFMPPGQQVAPPPRRRKLQLPPELEYFKDITNVETALQCFVVQDHATALATIINDPYFMYTAKADDAMPHRNRVVVGITGRWYHGDSGTVDDTNGGSCTASTSSLYKTSMVPIHKLSMDQLRQIFKQINIHKLSVRKLGKEEMIEQIYTIVLAHYNGSLTIPPSQPPPAPPCPVVEPLVHPIIEDGSSSTTPTTVTKETLTDGGSTTPSPKGSSTKENVTSTAGGGSVPLEHNTRWIVHVINAIFSPTMRHYVYTNADDEDDDDYISAAASDHAPTIASDTHKKQWNLEDDNTSNNKRSHPRSTRSENPNFFEPIAELVNNNNNEDVTSAPETSYLPCPDEQYQTDYNVYISKATRKDARVASLSTGTSSEADRDASSIQGVNDRISWPTIQQWLKDLIVVRYKMIQFIEASGIDQPDPFTFARPAIGACKMRATLSPFAVYYFYMQCMFYPTVTDVLLRSLTMTTPPPPPPMKKRTKKQKLISENQLPVGTGTVGVDRTGQSPIEPPSPLVDGGGGNEDSSTSTQVTPINGEAPPTPTLPHPLPPPAQQRPLPPPTQQHPLPRPVDQPPQKPHQLPPMDESVSVQKSLQQTTPTDELLLPSAAALMARAILSMEACARQWKPAEVATGTTTPSSSTASATASSSGNNSNAVSALATKRYQDQCITIEKRIHSLESMIMSKENNEMQYMQMISQASEKQLQSSERMKKLQAKLDTLEAEITSLKRELQTYKDQLNRLLLLTSAEGGTATAADSTT